MRELRTCDFCAADAVGTFEIVPPELEPTEAEQRRVVCCPDCRDRLETLLEPLLARVGVETDAATATDLETTDADAEYESDAGDESDATTDASAAADPSTAVTDTASDDAEAGGSEADDANADDSAADEPESGSDAALEAGITFERDERTAADEADEGDGSEDSLPAGGTESAADAEPATADSASADAREQARTDTAGSTASSTGPPTAYRKVVRLLRNREFPMQRSAVEELAAGAYDLEPHEAEAIVDYAVADGEFVEKQGKLRRP